MFDIQSAHAGLASSPSMGRVPVQSPSEACLSFQRLFMLSDMWRAAVVFPLPGMPAIPTKCLQVPIYQ